MTSSIAGTGQARWLRISALLDELVELAGEARARRVAEMARDDPPLAAELADLLSRLEAVERAGFLEGQAVEDPGRGALAGRVVGAYTIERALGQGGMGTVWLARRSDGRFEGSVAVKLLKLSLLGQAGGERFRHEGSILARLSHQNIARLVDAGVAEGQPYLVLEYVEGEPIDAWCDTRELGVEDRIRLFLGVLAAVAHAHDRLVLHRDLKPSNILVTTDGHPKLLDFGVAKLLEGEAMSGRATELTGQAGHPFTPGYAAPEQVQGGDATTATDVYALGVTLYCLLTGTHPAVDEAGSPIEVLRAVVERATPSASQAAGRTAPDVARRRRSTPTELARALRGDLDNILARALEKVPGQRYPTAHALADDLQRFLSHEPVAARAGTLAYRLGKAARRHRLAFATAAAIAVALVAGVLGTAWEAVEAGRQRAQAIRERERANHEAQRATAQRDFAFRQLSRAEAVADLKGFLLYEAAPNGRRFTAAELLGRAERIVSRQEPTTDANRVEMLVAIGRQYDFLENMQRARQLLEEAYDLSRKLDEPSIRTKAACALAATLARSGEGARAERIIQSTLTALPDEPQLALDRISCLRDGAAVARDSGDPSVAVDRARAAEELLARVGFPAGFLNTRVAMDLAESNRVAGRLREAADAFQRASGLLGALGRDDTETAGTLFNNWAVTLLQLGRPIEAEVLFRRATRISSADGGERSVSPLLLKNLASTLLKLDRLPEAAKLAERADVIARRAHQEVALNQALLVRADVYREMGDLSRSSRMLAEVEPRLKKMLPPGHYAFGALESLRSQLALARGDLRAARGAADRAISLAEASGQGPWLLSTLLTLRAEIELHDRRWDEARRYAERAVEQGRAMGGGETPSKQLGSGYLALGRALSGTGDAEGARASFASASAHLRRSLGPSHPLARMADRLAAEAAR